MRWNISVGIESLDYDLFESVVNKSGLEYQFRDGQEKRRLVYARWVCTMFIGIATALIAVIMLFSTLFISSTKKKLLQDCISDEKSGKAHSGYAFGMMLSINLTLVLASTALIAYGAEIAAGSGISEIKTMLNGVKIPRVLRLKTLLCKVLGTICSVSGGLPVGKEGPMIHSGAIMGAGLSQGKSSTLGYDTSFSYFAGFRNDHEKRDFVSCGAAAGVAAAFGAPIGGVLFVLEEGASFWNQLLTWRTLFCAMISTFTLAFNITMWDEDESFGILGSQSGTFSFGQFDPSPYKIWEVPIFVCMGIGGGLIGALFTAINTRLMYLRGRWITTKFRWILEAAVVSVLVSLLTFGLPYIVNTCRQRPDEIKHPNETYPYRKEMIGFYCQNPVNDHNDLATLFLSSGEMSIKQLFHAPPGTFHEWNLVLFFITSFGLACLTYGIKVPSGLFVPSLLIGAAYGRLWNHIVNSIVVGLNCEYVDVRTYGLIGSAAFLGGVTRMTISLTVILLECTGNIQYGLPLIVTLFSARWVGNYFNEGIYDTHIHLQHLPFLDWTPPLLGTFLRVKHVMARHPKCLRTVERAGIIYDMLMDTTHNGFPVVVEDTSVGRNFFAGIVLRKQLSVLLKKKDFSTTKIKPFSRQPLNREELRSCIRDQTNIDRSKFCLSYKEMEEYYPRYPNGLKDEFLVTEQERHLWVDLTPYMNETPYLILENAAFTRAYRLFRSSGLRHLIVVNRYNIVRGIITRHDLEEEHCTRCFRLARNSDETLYPSSPSFPMLPISSKDKLHRRIERKDQVERALRAPLLSGEVTGSSNLEVKSDVID